MRGLNLRDIKYSNKTAVLYLLNSRPKLSRKDIAEALDLTPAAVTKICQGLISEGLIEEIGEVCDDHKAGAGRKKISIDLCLDKYYTVGINAEIDKITVSVIRLDGKPVLSDSLPPDSSVDEIVWSSRETLYASGIDAEKFLCISLCVIGSPCDNRFGLWNIDEITDKASAVLKLPVVVENNIRAFATAQMIYGKTPPERSLLFLKWGPGIGSAISSNGEIVTGSDAGVAEIGHYIVRRDGQKCRCGRYGCLETEVSSAEIMRETGLHSVQEVLESRDSAVIHILDSKIDTVALALTNTATILNAEKIILFGSMFKSDDVVEKLVRQCHRYNINFKKNIMVLSELNDKISYIGAAALAAKQFFFEKDKN